MIPKRQFPHLSMCKKDKLIISPGKTKKPNELIRPVKLSSNSNPWLRLGGSTTCSKRVKEVDYCGPVVPKDRLEFLLRSEYDHHREAFKGSNEMCIQKETILKTMGTFRCCWAEEDDEYLCGIKSVGLCEKLNPNSVKTVIHSHHLMTSNNGYSRKPDGGFYSS